MQKINETLVRISIDPSKKPVEWDLWTRINDKAPWAFLAGGNATNISNARHHALRTAEQWVFRVQDSSVKVDILPE